jgi:hypothetical protein
MDAPSLHAHNEFAIASANGMTSLRRPGDRGERIDLFNTAEPVVHNDSHAPLVPRPAPRWRHPYRVAAIGMTVWLAVLACVMGLPVRVARGVGLLPPLKGPPFKVSPETTLITEPLDADGWPDYQAALTKKLLRDVKPENNFVVVLRQVGLLDNMEEGWFNLSDVAELQQIDARLGVTAPLPTTPRYRTYRELYPNDSSQDFANFLEQASQRFWREDEFPKFAAWLRVNEPVYDLLAESVRTLDCGFVAGVNCDQSVRTLYRDYATRSFRMDPPQPMRQRLNDLVTMLWIGRRASLLNEWYHVIVAVTGERIATEFLVEHLSCADLVEADLVWLIAELDRLPPRVGFLEAGELGDQYAALNGIVSLARSRDLDDFNAGIPKGAENSIGRCVRWSRVDWNVALRETRAMFEERRRIRTLEDIEEQSRAIQNERKRLSKQIKGWNHPWRVLLAPFLGSPRYNGQFIAALAVDARQLPENESIASPKLLVLERTLRIAIDLRRHQMRTGSYPDSLADLKDVSRPTDLGDPFREGQQLTYRRTSEGCLLYSLGRNGVDDDGESFPASDIEGADDIGVRLRIPVR